MEFRTATAYLTLIVAFSFCSGASLHEREAQDPPCRAEVLRQTEEYLKGNRPLNPKTLPQCDERGYYKALQRNEEGYMCSTPLGSPVDAYDYRLSGRGPCKAMKRCVRQNQAKGARDHKLIRCDKYGYFKELQKTETGGNICVLPYGHIVKTKNVFHKRDCNDAIIRSGTTFAH